MTQQDVSAPGKSKLKGCLLWGFGIFVALVVLAMIFGPEPGENGAQGDATQAADDPVVEEEDLPVVTATELISAYESNEMRAQQQYGDLKMRFEGRVANIQADFSDAPLISLSSEANEFMTANVGLDKDYADYASGLSKGQAVAFICDGSSEAIGFPQLKDCVPAE